MARWQLQDAKNRLSEVVRRARDEGPQVITLHGRDAVIVVSASEYTRVAKPKRSLVEFMRRSPLAGTALEIGRSRDTGRLVRLQGGGLPARQLRKLSPSAHSRPA